jgi:hypothetical protein
VTDTVTDRRRCGISRALSGRQLRRLAEALLHAYPSRGGLEQVLRFDLDRRLADLVGNVGMSEVVFAVITTGEAEGWLPDLVDAVLADRAGNPLLRAWAADTGWRPGAVVPEPPAGADNLERTVRARAPELDPADWRARLAAAEAMVCRIGAETPLGWRTLGTGFLVGPDLCLTACHVVDDVRAGGIAPSAVRLQFGYGRDDGSGRPAGATHELDADWLVACSPPSDVDRLEEPGDRLPRPDELDFAVLRVAGSPGLAQGWVRSVRRDVLAGYDELIMLQHLDGEPLSLAFGPTIDFNANGTRLRHMVNTAHGSSGAPVFDIAVALVGVHQGSDPDARRQHLPTHNRAVPIAAIRRALPPAVAAF